MTDFSTIPLPPSVLLESCDPVFEPSPEMANWVMSTFIESGSPLENPEHEHLQQATIGFLWANVTYLKQNRRILGTAQIGQPSGSNAWTKGRTEQQLRAWFGDIPDFLITLDAHYFADAGNPERCALVEHELCHCAQAEDQYGCPAFTNGLPRWAMRAHDVEEFVSVVERYGADATRTRRLVDAAQHGPTIAHAELDGICGLCEGPV